MAERIVNLVSAFVIGLLVIRYLGPEQFGMLSYTLAFALLFSGVAQLGLDMIIVRQVIQEPEELPSILTSAWFLRVVSACSTVLIVAFFFFLIESDTSKIFYLLIVAVGGVFQSVWVIGPVLQSTENFRSIALCKITQTALSGLIRVTLIYLGAPLTYFVIAIAVDYALLALIYFYSQRSLVRSAFSTEHIRYDRVVSLIKASFPILLSSLSIALYTKTDQVMIEHLVGTRSVGIYSASVRIVEASYFLPIIFASVCLPILVRARQLGEQLYNDRVRGIFSIMIFSGALVTSFLYFFADAIVAILFGSQYVDSVSVLEILSFATIFVYIGSLTTPAMVANNLQQFMFIRTMAAAAVNLVLNYVLITSFGMVGAAYATLITAVLAAFFFDGLSRRTRYLMLLKVQALVPRRPISR